MLQLIDNPYLHEEIATLVVLLFYIILRIIIAKVVKRFAQLNEVLEHRTNLIIKYINLLLGILALISITIGNISFNIINTFFLKINDKIILICCLYNFLAGCFICNYPPMISFTRNFRYTIS